MSKYTEYEKSITINKNIDDDVLQPLRLTINELMKSFVYLIDGRPIKNINVTTNHPKFDKNTVKFTMTADIDSSKLRDKQT